MHHLLITMELPGRLLSSALTCQDVLPAQIVTSAQCVLLYILYLQQLVYRNTVMLPSIRPLSIVLRSTLRHHPSISCLPRSLFFQRLMSSGKDDQDIKISTDADTGIATLVMQKTPVNALNAPFMKQIIAATQEVQRDINVKGLVITSNLPKMFCAGLDLKCLLGPTDDSIRDLWTSLQDMWLELYSCKLPIIAAVNGHAPAGGCVQTLTADYRFMAQGKFKLGLNEVHVGLPVPEWLCNTMVNVVGQRQAEYMCRLGLLLNPNEALECGLIDRVVVPDDLQSEAIKEMQIWTKVPATAQHITKLMLRQPTIDRFHETREEELKQVVKFITGDYFQSLVKGYFEKMKSKK